MNRLSIVRKISVAIGSERGYESRGSERGHESRGSGRGYESRGSGRGYESRPTGLVASSTTSVIYRSMLSILVPAFLGWRQASLVLASAIVFVATAPVVYGESAIDLIAGWDKDRIEAAFRNEDASERAAEMSRLLYRVSRHPASRYAQLEANGTDRGDSSRQIGDAASCDGIVESISPVAVPESLVDFVEFERIHLLMTEGSEDNSSIQIYVANIPRGLKSGDRIKASGVQLSGPNQKAKIAVPSLEWFPASVPDPGLAMLVDAGIDLTLIERMKQRQRKPLEAEDGDAFYGLLAHSPFPTESLTNVSPIQLLTKPADFTGMMIGIRVDVVQCTRVAVSNPDRSDELGSDHYYQLDGFVDLGDQEVVIRSSDDSAEPVTFGGRYPISLVSRTVPESLLPVNVNAANQSRLVDVDGIFFRLWSYQSDLMRKSKLDQFGPLVVASDFDLVGRSRQDSVGVGRIGIVASAALVIGVLAVTIWHFVTSRQDRAIRRRRQERL